MSDGKDLKPQGPSGIAYDEPTRIPAAQATRFLWGDERSGFVSDWIYGSSPKIHMMAFSLNSGQGFGYSPDFKTYYNAHETYYCLKGEFTFHSPDTGEVHVLRQGDALYIPPNTWHWGHNFGAGECRILESLTPRTEEALEAYAAKQPWLDGVRYCQDHLIGEFLPGSSKLAPRATLIRPQDHVHEIVGKVRPMRVEIIASTEYLTTGQIELYAGQKSEAMSHPGDKVFFVLSGQLNVHLPAKQGDWWELLPGDAAYIPAGCPHAFFNTSDFSTALLFSVAPGYR